MAAKVLAMLCIGIWILIGYAAYRLLHKEENQEVQFFDSKELQDEIHALDAMISRIAELDDMIIELRLCDPTRAMRAFRIEWQGTSGKNHGFDFLADGRSASSEHLLELAIAEREQLNTQAAIRIADIYSRACALSFYDEIEKTA